jgi:hypothetical protein
MCMGLQFALIWCLSLTSLNVSRFMTYIYLLHRPNIVEIHLALLLYTFLQAGLLEAIVEVIVSSDTFISVRATILLGNYLWLYNEAVCNYIAYILSSLLCHSVSHSDTYVWTLLYVLSHVHVQVKQWTLVNFCIVCIKLCFVEQTKQQSPCLLVCKETISRSSNRCLSGKLVPAFADRGYRGCRVVSATSLQPYSRFIWTGTATISFK